MKIAQKLVIIILVASTLPVAAVGLTTLSISHNALVNQIRIRINNTEQYQLNRIETINKQVATELNTTEFNTQLRLLMQTYNVDPKANLRPQLTQALTDILNSSS